MNTDANAGTQAQGSTQPNRHVHGFDPEQARRQAAFYAANPDGWKQLVAEYRAAGGRYFEEMDQAQQGLNQRLTQIERQGHIERALRLTGLTDDDGQYLTGTTADEIMASAQKLKSRIAAEAAKATETAQAGKQTDQGQGTAAAPELPKYPTGKPATIDEARQRLRQAAEAQRK